MVSVCSTSHRQTAAAAFIRSSWVAVALCSSATVTPPVGSCRHFDNKQRHATGGRRSLRRLRQVGRIRSTPECEWIGHGYSSIRSSLPSAFRRPPPPRHELLGPPALRSDNQTGLPQGPPVLLSATSTSPRRHGACSRRPALAGGSQQC